MNRFVAMLVGLLVLSVLTRSKAQDPKEAPKPPMGWKEFTPKDNAFTVWLPEKTTRQSERERTSTIRGQRLKVTAMRVEANGVAYMVEKVTLPPAMAKGKRNELEEIFKDALVSELKGKVKEDSDVKLGGISGKEYILDTPQGLAKVRLFVTGLGRVFFLYVTGPKDQVEKEDSMTFLNSCRLPVAKKDDSKTDLAKTDPKMESPGKEIAKTEVPATAKATKIMGGGGDDFKVAGPEGALLVGMEFGLGKFVNNDTIKAVRPIFRLKDEDMVGTYQGTEIKRTLKVVAKPGYAVGAVTIKAGAGLDGLSLTFMKVVDGKLDPKDAYESDWVGGKGGGGPEKLGGDGTPVIGIVGKGNKKEATGLGLLMAK